MSDKYSVNVFWENEDQCFIATCFEFPLLSAHGDTREEALSEFQLVLEMAIESYTEDNLELPKPKTSVSHSGQFRLRIPKTLHRNLSEAAEKENVSLNTYVISLLSENHTLKKIYSDQFKVMKKIVGNLTTIFDYQTNELQVHTQRLDLLESQQTIDQVQIESSWSHLETSHHTSSTSFSNRS